MVVLFWLFIDVADTSNVSPLFTDIECMGEFPYRHLSHAVDKYIRFRVKEYRFSKFIAPVVIVCDTSKTCFDTSKNYRHGVFKVLAYEICVDQYRSIGTFVIFTSGGVVIGFSKFFCSCIICNHRVYAPTTHTPVETRFTQTFDILITLDIWLTDDTHFVAQLFKHTSYSGNTDKRRVDIGITTDENYITLIPATCFHLFTCSR